MTAITTSPAQTVAHDQKQGRLAKWGALIEDQYIPAPQRRVAVKVLKAQANISPEFVLVRDYGGADLALADDEIVDLAEGNVFYAVPRSEAPAVPACLGAAKMAFFVDDRPEITFRGDQTGQTLRELFGFSAEVHLFRDFESPVDQTITPNEPALFMDGPVFYTRRKHALFTIFVNDKPFTEADGAKQRMTGRNIARLISEEPENFDVYAIPSEVQIGLDQTVEVATCDRFKVIRKTVSGGFEPSRIQRELDTLRSGGGKITFLPDIPAVVYHDIPTRKDYPHALSTDVLVMVPGGYPARQLDGAYLPAGSPLLNRVVGKPQGNTVQALAQHWTLVSYHPHGNGGGKPWNKDQHGFHTYVDELLTWVHRAAV
jgi:hypothetical protein